MNTPPQPPSDRPEPPNPTEPLDAPLIPKRVPWGGLLIVGVPLGLYTLAYFISTVPRLTGLEPSDETLQSLIDNEGQPIVTVIEQYVAQYGEHPPSFQALDEDLIERLPSEAPDWLYGVSKHGPVLAKEVSPNNWLEYVFVNRGIPPGWYTGRDQQRRKLD